MQGNRIASGVRRRSLALFHRFDPRPVRLLFVFIGSAGWAGTGESLYRQHPPFRVAIDRASALVEDLLGFSPAQSMRGEWQAGSFAQARELTAVSAVLTALTLCDMWREVGVQPAGTMGISIGEAVAAYAAGAISHDDAISLTCSSARGTNHSRAMQDHFVASPRVADDIGWWRQAPKPLQRTGTIARGVDLFVMQSSDAEANAAFLAEHARIETRYSAPWRYHVLELEIDEGPLRKTSASLQSGAARCPIYATSLGGRVPPDTVFDADYFLWEGRAPIALDGALTAALGDGYDAILNVGPSQITAWLDRSLRDRPLPVVSSVEPGQFAVASWRQAVGRVRALHRSFEPRPKPQPPEDPFTCYPHWLAEGPIKQLSGGRWIVLGEPLIREALSRPADFSTEPYHFLDTLLLGADGETHRAARAALAPHFVRGRVELATAAVARCARLPRPARFDAVSDFAVPVAHASAAAFVGLSDAHAAGLLAIAGRRWPGAPDFAAIAAAGEFFAASELADALHRQGVTSDDAEVLARTAWIAALMSTERSIAWSLFHLLQDPALLSAVLGLPERLRRFADEIIRLYPAEMLLPRHVERDAVLGGVALPAGATVLLAVVAANRDPQTYPDPDRIDLARPTRAHLSFGAHAHACLGAAMARNVVARAVDALFAAMPNLRPIQPIAGITYYRSYHEFSLAGLAVQQ